MNEIRRIMELLPTTQEIPNEDSFFDIIGRGHDEDLISRMLKYLFENNLEILNGLLKNKNEALFKEIISIECEKTIDNGQRMDLFIIGTNQNNKATIIVIENKVYSWEHDDQCNAYYEDTNRKYSEFQCIYFYLKPRYNLSSSNCSYFKTIIYDDIYNILLQMNKRSRYEEDFLVTIKNNLMENAMEEIDYKILNNYQKLQSLMNQNLKRMENYNKSLASMLAEELALKFEEADNHKTYRFYKEEYKTKEYYFYIEFKYENNDFSTIYFQYTIQRFEKTGDSLISKFANNKNFKKPAYDYWYVIKREEIKIKSNNILSTEWKKEMKDVAKEKLENFSKELTNLFSEFKKYNS